MRAGELALAAEIYVRGDANTTGADSEHVLLQQRETREPSPLLYREQDGAVRLKKRLVLGSVKHPRVAECVVELRLSSREIRLEYVATQLVALSSHGNVFITHIRLAEAAWVGRGARAEYQRAGPRLFVLPFHQAQAGALNLGGLSALRVGMEKELLLLAAGQDSAMRLLDDPGWGGKFSVHVHPGYTWFAQPLEQPAGETCRWSVRLALTDAESESK